MSSSEREAWNRQFVLWGERTIDALAAGDLEPARAPEYIIQHYGAQLERSDTALENIRSLLTESWLRAWEHLDPSYNGFLIDVQRVANYAERERDIGLQIRCALCQSSIVALSSEIPDRLILACLEKKLITPIYVLRLMRHNSSEPQQARILPLIFPQLDERLKYQIFDIIRSMERPWFQVEALSAIARRQDPLEQEITLRRAMTLTESIEERHGLKNQALEHLIEALPNSMLLWAIDIARSFHEPYHRINPLFSIALRLKSMRFALLQEVLVCIRQDDSAKNRIYGFSRIAPYLDNADKEATEREILDAIPILEAEIAKIKHWGSDGWSLANTMIQAILAFPDSMREGALRIARALPIGAWRAQLICAVAKAYPPEEQGELFRESIEACRIDPREILAGWELQVAAHLSEILPDAERKAFLEDILATTCVADQDKWIGVLGSVTRVAPQEFFNRCVQMARSIRRGKSRSHALLGLVDSSPSDEQDVLLREAWDAARNVNDEREQCRTLACLMKELAEDERSRFRDYALRAAWALHGEERARSLLRILNYLPEPELHRANEEIMFLLEKIEGFGLDTILRDEWQYMSNDARLHCLRKFCAYLQEGRNVNFSTSRLLGVAKYLPEEERNRAVQVSRERLSRSPNDYYKAMALRSLSTYSEGDEKQTILGEALDVTRRISIGHDRAWSLAYHVEYVDESERKALIQESLDAAKEDMSEDSQESLIATLVQYADGQQLETLVKRARRLPSASYRLRALISIITNTEKEARQVLLQEVLSEAFELTDESLRAEILSLVIPLVNPEERIDIVERAAYASCSIFNFRPKTFRILSPHLATWSSIDENASHKAGSAILKSSATRTRATFLDDLEALLPWVAAQGRPDTLSVVAESIADSGQWWP